jgi:hypothetical protein
MTAHFSGRSEEAWKYIEAGLDWTEKGEDWFYRAPLHSLGAAILADLALADEGQPQHLQALGVLVRGMQSADSGPRAADFPAQLAQTEAEMLRGEGRSRPSSWGKAAALWEEVGEPYPTAYCRFRQGEALIATGERDQGNELLDQAAGVAARLGAAPLAQMIEAVRKAA